MAAMTLDAAVRVACAAMEYKRAEYEEDRYRTQMAVDRAEDRDYRDRHGPAEVARYRRQVDEIDEAMAVLRKAAGW